MLRKSYMAYHLNLKAFISCFMKKSFFIVCLFSFLCGISFAQDVSKNTLAVAGPQLEFVTFDSVYDIGVIPLGSSIDNQLEFKNTGKEILTISDVKCDMKNMQFKWSSKRLKPGKSAYLTLIYEAHGDNGSFKTEVYIYSNAAVLPKVLHISGANIPSGGTYMPSNSTSTKSKGKRH